MLPTGIRRERQEERLNSCRMVGIRASRRLSLVRACGLLFSGGLVWFAASVSSQTPQDAKLQSDFDAGVLPLLRKYCFSCHGGAAPTGGFALDLVTSVQQVRGDAARWRRLREHVATGHMPPPGVPQPTAAERRKITDWVGALLGARKAGDPGRVTIRRLNRSEYNNTVRDLLYLSVAPAEDFPSDDVGYGFDNIGDVLTISPLLMEKYIAAAERLAGTAIVLPLDRTVRFEASEFGEVAGSNVIESGDRNFFTNGFMGGPCEFPADGDYVIRARAFGQQAGPEVCKMAFRVNGRQIQVVDVAAVRAEPGVYQVPVTIKKGTHRVEVGFINDYYNPGASDPRQRDRNLIIQYYEVAGPKGVEATLPDSHTRLITVYPGTLDHTTAARKVIGDFARRAFRRPVTNAEIDKLVAIYRLVREKGDPYERGIQVAVTAVLASPSFIFRSESDAKPSTGGTELIGEYAMASRLSYFLWSSMPDQELFDLAAAGRLSDPKVLEAQVDRMLKSPKSRALADDFAAQWLNLRLLETLTPDAKVFDSWSEQTKLDMVTETKTYFMDVVANDRPIVDFLDSDYTFVNERLAQHYGLSGVRGEEFRRVQLTDRRRGGLVTQGSALTVTSNPNRTSPVKRGKWILDNILGGTPPPPPPDVGVIEDGAVAMESASLRERMERHRRDPNCAGCHNQMDPLGFALENFDGVGRWRETDGKWPIDDTGVLPDGTKFQGANGLRALLVRRKDDFAGVLASKLLTYALGRGLEAADGPTVERIRARVVRNGYRFSEVVKGVVTSDAFRKRLAEK